MNFFEALRELVDTMFEINWQFELQAILFFSFFVSVFYFLKKLYLIRESNQIQKEKQNILNFIKKVKNGLER
jgi:hypothetical protein